MKYSVIFIFIAFSAISCKKENVQKISENPSAEINKGKSCYLAVIGKDSVALSLNQSGDDLSGEINYNFFEKDKSSGTFIGIRSGDTLKLQTKTLGEGRTTYTDVNLLEKDGKLHEGVGEVQQINDSTFAFVEPAKIDYSQSFVFFPRDCK